MNNQTTVKTVSVGAFLAMVIVWLLGAFLPDLMATAPDQFEIGLALFLTTIWTYIVPGKKS